MQDANLIEFQELILPLLAEEGYDLVQAKKYTIHGKSIVQVMIERKDAAQVEFSDCKNASHLILDLLESHDPIGGDYNLEVSSAGLERPLVKLEDFERFKGSKAKLVLKEKIEGRRQLIGTLNGVQDGQVNLKLEETADDLFVDVNNLQKAHLVVDLDAYDFSEA